jgi:hypothetical protein
LSIGDDLLFWLAAVIAICPLTLSDFCADLKRVARLFWGIAVGDSEALCTSGGKTVFCGGGV